jgi:hypothetical protein
LIDISQTKNAKVTIPVDDIPFTRIWINDNREVYLATAGDLLDCFLDKEPYCCKRELPVYLFSCDLKDCSFHLLDRLFLPRFYSFDLQVLDIRGGRICGLSQDFNQHGRWLAVPGLLGSDRVACDFSFDLDGKHWSIDSVPSAVKLVSSGDFYWLKSERYSKLFKERACEDEPEFPIDSQIFDSKNSLVFNCPNHIADFSMNRNKDLLVFILSHEKTPWFDRGNILVVNENRSIKNSVLPRINDNREYLWVRRYYRSTPKLRFFNSRFDDIYSSRRGLVFQVDRTSKVDTVRDLSINNNGDIAWIRYRSVGAGVWDSTINVLYGDIG